MRRPSRRCASISTASTRRAASTARRSTLVLQDDSAEPSKAAANAKKLLTQDNAVLVINASLSSTYAPMVERDEARRRAAAVRGSVCPKEVYPPAAEALNSAPRRSRRPTTAARRSLHQGDRQGAGEHRLRRDGDPDLARRDRLRRGQAPEDRHDRRSTRKSSRRRPPDYTPFATKIKDAGANWVFSWAPWVTQVRTFEALRRLGWQGDYLTWAHLEAEGELPRLKDDNST